MTRVDVTGCANCPFADGDKLLCRHPARRGTAKTNEISDHLWNDDQPPPPWCPLRVNTITVSLVEGA